MTRVFGGGRWQPKQYAARMRLDRRKKEGERQLRALRTALLAEQPAIRDETDQCAETVAAELGAAVLELEAISLQKIDEALRQVELGLYGMCAECGGEISRARLRALPFADLCRSCQLAREREGIPTTPSARL